MSNNELVLLRRIEDLEKLIQRQPEVGGVWQSYTPVWTAATTNPSIGNGTLAGTYCVVGKMCVASIFIQFGSTTNAGSGRYSFTPPLSPIDNTTAVRHGIGTWNCSDTGTANYTGTTLFFSSTVVQLSVNASSYVAHNIPFTFSSTDIIRANFTYEIA